MIHRISRFLKRHGTRAPRMAMWAGLRTACKQEGIRRLIRPFFSPRRPEKWVFVVGCYNSGTTVTQALLAAHPQIRTLPWEGSLITSVLPTPEDKGWTRMWIKCIDHMKMPDDSPPKEVDRLLKDWAPWWSRGGSTFLEKSITNGTRMEWLDQHLAPAYFISVVRDGYCASEGIRRKGIPRGLAADKVPDGRYPIEWAAEQWVAANEQILASSERVNKFKQVRYEDLIADPESTLKELWSFLDLSLPDLARTNNKLRIAKTNVSLDLGMNKTSLGRLSSEDVKKMTPIIGGLHQQFGYDKL